MSVELDRASAPPTIIRPVVNDTRLPVTTMEEADAARRRAAEHGDYVTAQRWLWNERLLATQEERANRP